MTTVQQLIDTLSTYPADAEVSIEDVERGGDVVDTCVAVRLGAGSDDLVKAFGAVCFGDYPNHEWADVALPAGEAWPIDDFGNNYRNT